MTTKLLIDRELLEQVASEFEHDNDRYMLGRELRKVLDTPRQPEGDGLTRYTISIVGGISAFVSADDGCMVLYEDAQRAIAELRGLVPELPPRPPEGDGMPRYGLRWNGPRQPVSVPMADGYWTPWHLAEAECERLTGRMEPRHD